LRVFDEQAKRRSSMANKTMTIHTSTRPRIKPSEEGYMLIAVMFMLAILLIAMSVAVPKIAKQIQRDREIETMHRGKQYVRGIKMYYTKFTAYPTSIDALVQTNNIRFLRKKYIDPTTGKDEWKVIHLGQNKVPTAWGFFGVPLGGPGAGGPCGNGLTGSNPASSGASASNFGSPGSGSSFGSSTGTSNCPPDSSTSTPGTDPNAQNPNGQNSNGQSNTTDPNAGNGTPGTGTGLTGQTFGGGGIIGVSPAGPKQSILVLHKKNHYKEWEFVYDPLAEQMMMQQGGNIGAGLNPNNPTTPNSPITPGSPGVTPQPPNSPQPQQ
jgi:type II secretory pathway pseudopilin PulG